MYQSILLILYYKDECTGWPALCVVLFVVLMRNADLLGWPPRSGWFGRACSALYPETLFAFHNILTKLKFIVTMLESRSIPRL